MNTTHPHNARGPLHFRVRRWATALADLALLVAVIAVTVLILHLLSGLVQTWAHALWEADCGSGVVGAALASLSGPLLGV
jgi:hypothetical protein